MRLPNFIRTALLVLLLTLASPVLMAQERRSAVPPPEPPRPRTGSFELEKIALEVVIDGQKASCVLKYVLYNPTNSPLEVDFLAPLPEGGTVTGLTLFDGKTEMPGQIYNKDEAHKIYRDIVAKQKDPALLEYAGLDTFRARVFPVPPKGRQNLDLNFDFLLPKSDGQVDFNFPLAGPMTAGRTPEQEVHLVIKEAPGLASLYSPLAGVSINHQAGQDAVVGFQAKNSPVLDRFRLYFQTKAGGPVGGLILSHKPDPNEDGFFLFLAEPALKVEESKMMSKNVIFVLDKSGSMNGPKFTQAKEALRYILERLDPGNNFNLVDYNSSVNAWKPELMDMSPENRRSALAYVDNLRSGGSTNIEEALQTAFKMVGDPSQPNYIIFLTDGQATVGEMNEMKLADLAKKANPQGSARLFSFGLGFDVNARLLDRLSGQAGGSSAFVDPDENLEDKVSGFFNRLTSPILLRPELTSNRPINQVLPAKLPDLFIGQQMVAVGRYPMGGDNTFTLSGRQGEKTEKFTYQAKLAEGPSPGGQFIAALWAQRRIGEIIDEIDLAGGQPNQELVEELVQLSKKYGILTPYTSFLALEDQNITRRADLVPLVTDNLSIMSETAGQSANAQRAYKADSLNSVRAGQSSLMRSEYFDQAGLGLDASKLDKQVQKLAEPTQDLAAAMPVIAITPSTSSGSAIPYQSGSAADQMAARKPSASPGQSAAPKLSPPNHWAGQTFFFKNGQWQAENLTEDDLKKVTTVKQLSEEYFTLAGKLKPEEMVWLTQKEPVLFKYDGVNYLIEPHS